VLADLARHPATAKHIATKLARHFVADAPPPALIETLTGTFLETDGDLKELAKALIASPEAWATEQAKIKRPGEWIAAGLRATAEAGEIGRIIQAQNLLGEPLWRPPAPQGFPDREAAWVDGLAMRLDVANTFALQALERAGEQLDPNALVDDALGPLASTETRQAVARAESRAQALALLVMSPEFQRR
jgi:uncharacterized protein (DUF1800 family)